MSRQSQQTQSYLEPKFLPLKNPLAIIGTKETEKTYIRSDKSIIEGQ